MKLSEYDRALVEDSIAHGKRIVLEMAKEADFQVIMTRVIGEHGPSAGAVVIEDGIASNG